MTGKHILKDKKQGNESWGIIGLTREIENETDVFSSTELNEMFLYYFSH